MNTWKNLGIFAVTALSLGVVACGGDGATGPAGSAGTQGDPGAKGDPGDATPKSVGVVVPNIGLLDRELDVTITTNGVDLTKAAPAVDVGPGVTVSGIQVLSATTIYAHLAVDADAPTGARDVKVTEGADTLTSTKGFTVAEELKVSTIAGKAQQGALWNFLLENQDHNNPFDPSGLVAFSDGATDDLGGLSGITATRASGTYIVAPLAAATSEMLAFDLDASGSPYATFAGSYAVAPATPTTVTPGTPLTGQNIPSQGATNLYKFAAGTNAIVEISVTPTGTVLDPEVTGFGTGGLAADRFGLGVEAAPIVFPAGGSAQTNFFVVNDYNYGGGDAADYGYTVNVDTHTGTAFAEPATAHATSATAAAVTALPLATSNDGVIISGHLAAGEDDWYAIDLTADDSIEIGVSSSFDGVYDFTDPTELSFLDYSYIDPSLDFRLHSGIQNIAPSTTVTENLDTGDTILTDTYYLHVSGVDTSSTGDYRISLRRR